jgi:hypothetical protein
MKNLLILTLLLISLVLFAETTTHTGINTSDTSIPNLIIRLDSLEEQILNLQGENEALKTVLSEVQGDVSESSSLDTSVVESLSAVSKNLENISKKTTNQDDSGILITNIALVFFAGLSFLGAFLSTRNERKRIEAILIPEIEINFMNFGLNDLYNYPETIKIKNNSEYTIVIQSFKLKMFSLNDEIDIKSLHQREEIKGFPLSEEIISAFKKNFFLLEENNVEGFNIKAKVEISIEIKTRLICKKLTYKYKCSYQPKVLSIKLEDEH